MCANESFFILGFWVLLGILILGAVWAVYALHDANHRAKGDRAHARYLRNQVIELQAELDEDRYVRALAT